MNMVLLIIGSKNWPSKDSCILHEKMGGSDKYIFNLYTQLSKNSSIKKIYVISQKLPHQKSYENFSEKIEVFRVPFIKSRLFRIPSYNLFALASAINLLKNERIDLIHVHLPISIFSGVLLGKLFSKPVIGTLHGVFHDVAKDKNTRFLLPFAKFLERKICPQLTRLIFLEDYSKSRIESEMQIKYINACLIPSGVERLFLECRNNVRVRNTDKFVIIFVGRLIPIKGVENLVKCFSILPKDVKNNVCCKILGSGYLKHEILNIIEKEKLQQIVHVLGFETNVWHHLYSTNLFVLPSISEGFPMALIEAMSVGLPCIVNDWGKFLPEGSVYVISNNKPGTIAKAITKLYYDKELQRKLGENAYKVCKEKFSFDKAVRKHAQLYKSICKGGGGI